jgi:murein DD-endopeptidase MepM/ murein hydrolase activator NlpD
LSPTSQAISGRVRHWIVDLMIGGSAALIALPSKEEPAGRLRPAQPVVAAAEPAEPDVLIAFTEPLPGHDVISPFGMRKLPWEEGGRLHEGVDIAAPPGAPVLAVADGVVEEAGQGGGYGRYVKVAHAAGVRTIYAHLGAIEADVKPGRLVKIGAPIARVGSTGTSTGPHLHFEIRDVKGRPLNPSYFIDRSFAEADDLPLRTAARVPRGMRIAYVSRIPDSKKALMEARAAEKAGKGKRDVKGLADDEGVLEARLDGATGRPRATIQVSAHDPAAMATRRAMIAQVAASQKAEMAAEPVQAPVGEAAPTSAEISSEPAA